MSSVSEGIGGSSKRVLEPYERISEMLFGLIMVLTFTGSLSVAEAGRADVRVMLIGALGCNFAWGIIDAILYLMGCLSTRGQNLRALHALRRTEQPEDGYRIIAGALPPLVASLLSPAEYESLRRKLIHLPAPPERARLEAREWLGALSVFLWVFLATFPVAIPFLYKQEIALAMRSSNAIAIVMLFLTGTAFGRVIGYRPWLTGLAMVVLGCILVGVTMALGG